MGYPEFLKKYISYSLPEEQKRVQQTVEQMSNFPKPLSKYLGGEVKLGAVKQQPTMGELGYSQQKSPELAYSREFEQVISTLPPEKRLDYVRSQSFWFNKLSQDIGDWFKKHIPKASPKTQNLLNKASDIAGYITVPVIIATGTLAGLGMLEASAPYAYSENPVLRTVGKVGERIQMGRISLQKIQQTAAQYKEALQTFKKLGASPDTNGYRKLIKTYHPDVNPSYSELASKINDSYQTIETVNKMKKSAGLITKILSYFVKSAPNLPLHSLPESIKEPVENATKIINELQRVKDPETVKIFGTTPVTPASLAKYASKLEGNFQVAKSDIPKLLQPIETELIQPVSRKVSGASPTTEHISDFEQKELTKKGLTGLQPTEGYIYVGIRNPKTLEKIKQSGKLKVDRTSEKMGIFATPYISIANDYAKRTGVILKIPFTEDLKKAVIPDKIDKRLKQVRINKDIDLSNALIKQGDKWEKFKESRLVKTFYHGSSGMNKMPDVIYTTSDPSYAKHYGGKIYEYKVKIDPKKVLHIKYDADSNFTLDGRKMDFTLLSKEDIDFIKKHGYDFISADKPNKEGFEFIVLKKTLAKKGKQIDSSKIPEYKPELKVKKMEPRPVKTISAKKKTKEPWEMTQEEFVNRNIDTVVKRLKQQGKLVFAKRWDSEGFRKHSEQAKKLQEGHYTLVKKALQAGKPVPPEVLKEYPDLEKKYKANITEKAIKVKKEHKGINTMQAIGYVVSTRQPTTELPEYFAVYKNGIKPVTGKVYPFKYKGFDFFVHKERKNWAVREKTSGGWLAEGNTKKEAIAKAKEILDEHTVEETKKAIQRNIEFVKKNFLNKPKSQPVAQENPFSKLKTYQKVVKNMGYTPEQVMREFEKSKKTDEDILKARKKLVDFTHQVKLAFSDKEARKFDKFIHEKYLSKLKSGSLLKVLDERVKQKVEEAEYPKDVENKPGYMNTHIVSKLLEGIKTIVNKAHDWTIAYGELRRTNPEAYDKFITAVDKAAGTLKVELIKLQKKLKPFENKVTGKDLTLMATAIEEGKTPEEAFPNNKIAQKLMKVLIEENEALEKIKKEYHLTGDFRESYMAALDNEIEKLEKSKKADDVAKAQYLQELREQVEKMRYEPRSLLVSKILSSRNSAELVKKIKNLNALQSSYKHRKGVSTLAEWIDKGIVKPEEVNAIALTALNRVETTTKLIWRKMYKDFEKDGLIRKATPELKEMGWVPADKIGIRDRYLNGKLIQPGLARAFAEYINSLKPASVLDRILGIIKVGNFIKPTIIWKYDIEQALFRGLYSLNPYVDAKVMIEAIHHVYTKDEFYQKLVKSGVLAGSGMEPGKKQLDREIEVFAKQYPKEYSKLAKILRKILGRQNIIVDDKSIGRTLLNIATFATDNISYLTWLGDEVFRVFGVLMAEQMGYSEKEAMAIAKCAFGDYNLLSNNYKKAMHKVFFVYAFRFLMPMEMSKTLFTEPTRAILRTIHGEKVPKYEIERILKALLGFFGIIFVVDWYFREKKGMKPLGHHLGKLAWGYGKTVVENGEKKQIVYKTNYILNMFIKYWNRFTTYDPTDPTSPVLQVAKRVLLWEVQPAYRIGYEIIYNRPSFGNRKYVYDPSSPPLKQVGDMWLYAFEQSFRVYAVMDDILSTDDRVQYAKDQQRIINKHFGVLDKMIMNAFGYSYVRSGDTQRYMLKKLDAAYKRRISEIKRDYPNNPEKRRKMIENAKAWAKRSREYIIKHYPKN